MAKSIPCAAVQTASWNMMSPVAARWLSKHGPHCRLSNGLRAMFAPDNPDHPNGALNSGTGRAACGGNGWILIRSVWCYDD